MADFALVIFNEDKDEPKSDEGLLRKFLKKSKESLFKSGFFKSKFGSKFLYFIKRKSFNNSIKKIEFYDNLNIWLIDMPFSLMRLSQLNNKLFHTYINKICLERNIKSCYLPTCAGEMYEDGPVIKRTIIGNIVFKALLTHILDEIYTNKGFRVDNLDIVVIPGDNNEELLALIRLLEPNLRYITIVSEFKEDTEKLVADIANESGLSISVSTDYKKVLKNADLLINLSKDIPITKYRVNSKSLIINFDNSNKSIVHSENIIINGIEYNLPKSIYEKIGHKLLTYFNNKELSEFILINKLELIPENPLEYSTALRIQEEYIKSCYKITNFIGQRGTLSLNDTSLKRLY